MSRNGTGVRSFGAAFGLSVTAAVVMAVWCGCSGDARLADKKVRSATVRSATHYGVTLDQQATPEQVAFVLLRAIRDDVSAESKQDRETALDVQFDLCAANAIQKKNPTTMPRDEFIHNVVYHWAPTVSHYVSDFDTEWEKASARLVRAKLTTDSKGNPEECEVLMELSDPSGNPNARVVMVIWMARDEGYWRVMHLGFDPTRRSIGNST